MLQPPVAGPGSVTVMGWLDRVRRGILEGPAPFDGLTGPPPSGNGASSFHLFWDVPAGHWVGAQATFELAEPPAVDKLYFWAMQVGFAQGSRGTGAGHVGPQWFSRRPGQTAINWGGYGADGRELSGSVSPLPSASGNVNTRDYVWHPGRPYRLLVERSSESGPGGQVGWRASVTDLRTGDATFIRDLYAPGDRIESPMVWSEVFAACDDPPAAVRWTDLAVIASDGGRAPVTAVTVNYQALADGGCQNTSSDVDAAGFVQRTNTARTTPAGSRLTLDRRS